MKSKKKQAEKIKKRQQIMQNRFNRNKESTLWKAFLKQEEPDFREAYKFGKTEIEKIGVEKFFKTMGFEKKEDLSKWRTDVLHVCICPDCKKDFGIYEFYSVCPNCEKKYDMSRVKRAHTLTVSENKEEANPGEFLFAFMFSKQLRNFYLLNSSKDKLPIYALKYNQDTQSWQVNLIQDLTQGSIVKFVLSDGSTYKEDNIDTFKVTAPVKYDEKTFELSIEYEATKIMLPINTLSD